MKKVQIRFIVYLLIFFETKDGLGRESMPDSGMMEKEREGAEINLKPTMESLADELSIRYAYLYLFGRNPESDDVVKMHAAVRKTIMENRDGAMQSGEYRKKFTMNVFEMTSRRKIASMPDLSYDLSDSSEDVILYQTADPHSYSGMLDISKKYNKKFCLKNNLSYYSFEGIRYGFYPHHATYNRVFLLWDLINSGYRGWVFYLDADAIVKDPEWDIRRELLDSRKNGKIMIAHRVHSPDDPRYNWWDINAGAFLIDCASNHGRLIIDLWHDFYVNLYTREDLIAAREWTDIVDDQSSLHYIFQMVSKFFDLHSEIRLTSFQFEKVHQALRRNASTKDSQDGIRARCESLQSVGASIWGEDV